VKFCRVEIIANCSGALGGDLVSTKVVRDLFSTTGHRERSHIIREEQQEEKRKRTGEIEGVKH
jgi:hypothetical protein